MRPLLFPLYLLALPASAWEVSEGPRVALPAQLTGMAVAPMGTKDVVLALGAEATWIVDVEFGEIVRTLDRGGVAAARLDTDGDGRQDLVLCGPSGMWVVPWEGRYGGESTQVSAMPCAAVQTVRSPEGSYLAAAGPGWVGAFEPTSSGLVPSQEALFQAAEGVPLLASNGPDIAYAIAGSTEVRVREGQSLTTLTASGPIGDLVWARGAWTWTLPSEYAVSDSEGRETPVPDAWRLLPSVDQLLVVGDGVSTWLTQSEVEAVATPTGLTHGALAEISADYCADLIVADGASVMGLTGTCAEDASVSDGEFAPPETPATEQPRLQPPRIQRRRMVLGVEVPSFLGYEQASRMERMPRQSYLVVGSGWAMGATLGPTDVQIPFFPALAMGYEVGGPRVRFFAGVDSAALFFWIRPDGQGGGIHLANVTLGATFGSPALRIGPILTGGLLNYGGGLRAVLTPWTAGGSSKGIEARMTVFGPSTGEVMVLYVWSQPSRRSASVRDPALIDDRQASEEFPPLTKIPGPAAKSVKARAAAPICGEFSVAAGLAASVSSTIYSWTFVGANDRVAFGGSPAVAFGCSAGLAPRRPAALFLGMESAPFLRYFLYQGGSTGTDRLSHFGTLSVAPMLGSERFAVGPLGVAGIWELGGGVRTVLGLHTDRQDLRHQLELRAWALYKGAPAGEIMLLYGFSWDPWKRPNFRED